MTPNSHDDARRQFDAYRIEGVFRREGEYWALSDGQIVIRLRHSLGLWHISKLLRHPGRDFLALDLIADCDCARLIRDDGAQMLDFTARAAFKRRLKELREELEEAVALNDVGRRTRILEEIEFIENELMRATGFCGQARKVRGELNRARVNVTRTIRQAIARVTINAPRLGSYLNTTIKTGCNCSYTPIPYVFATWEF